MENVFDKKRKQNLNFILPAKSVLNGDDIGKGKKIVIIIHLHYIETVNNYLEYIQSIPEYIDILFTASCNEVARVIEKSILNRRKNGRMIRKQNRGRDISALLVACRKEILKYEYVCFLHDKKEKEEIRKQETKKWVQCLWENMVGSREYIENLIMVFYENPQIGILAPPSFISENFSFAYTNTWYQNFSMASELAANMGLNCDMDQNKPPITLGTTFWARVEALRKLLEIEWRYEDFEEEPLKTDGTLSHAVERILAYVAQDAGFDTGWVMTDRYAGERMEFMLGALEKAFGSLQAVFGISKISEAGSFEERKSELLEFVNRYECFYIYGAGIYGKRCLAMLKSELKIPKAFFVSHTGNTFEKIEGIPVFSFADAELCGRYGIVIAVSKRYQAEVENMIMGRDVCPLDVYLFRNG